MLPIAEAPASLGAAPGGASLLLRRPLLLAFVLGSAVSVLASGRFTLRLIADGALSMAFVPACQILGLAVVYPLRRRPVSFARAVDLFFTGNTVWLFWMSVFMVLGAALPVLGQGRLSGPFLMSSIVPIGWSVVVDARFFRDVMGRTGRLAARDLLIERVVAWSAAMLYFLAIAEDGRLGHMLYLFVEIRDVIVAWVTS
jgi:uncharacterized MnhB-related membrane protein